MSNNALMMAIIGTLHPVAAVVAGIVPVGSKATAKTFVFATGTNQPAQSMPCALPSGCVVGDTVVLTCAFVPLAGSAFFGPPAGATTAQINSFYYGVGRFAVFTYKLTPTDISAGTVTMSVTINSTDGSGPTFPGTVVVDAYRTVADSALDVVGALTFGPETLATSGATHCTAPGITTTAAGDMLQYAVFAASTAAGVSFTPPAGWAAGDTSADGTPIVRTCHATQPSAGATGDVTAQLSGTFPSGTNYKALLLSLRKADTTFRLAGTLPNATVGTAWTGVLTFAGDYTGTITVDASAGTIPAWMGTPTIDTTAKTITWSGTPTTAKTESFTPRATSAGGQVAVGSAQSVVVSAASSLPVIKQALAVRLSAKTSTISSADGWATPAANSILLLLDVASSSGITKPSGWNNAIVTTPGSNRNILAFWKKSLGTESSIVPGAFGAALLEISGIDTAAPIHLAASQAIAGKPGTSPTLTPTIANTLAIAAATWNAAEDATGATYTSGWTFTAGGMSSQTFNPFVISKQQDGSLAPVSGSVSPVAGAPDGASILILLKPA